MGFDQMVAQEWVKELLSRGRPLASQHEALGVLMEKFAELRQWVYLPEDKRPRQQVLVAFARIAAVCSLAAEDLLGDELRLEANRSKRSSELRKQK